MLPYALVMLELLWEDGRSLEVRLLDPTVDGATFRLSHVWAEEMKHNLKQVRFHFLHLQSHGYTTIESSCFTCLHLEEPSGEESYALPGSRLYRIRVMDEGFRREMKRLTEDYAGYISARQEMDETELMAAFGTFAPRDEYSASEQQWKEKQVGRLPVWTRPLLPVQLALSLDEPRLLRLFLILPWADFLEWYMAENGLTGHPIWQAGVTHIYLGSSFCMQLCPSAEKLPLLLTRVRQNGLIPVLCLPPVAEGQLNRAFALLQAAHIWAAKEAGPLEVVVNDLGTALMLHSRESGPGTRFRLTGGLLLQKRKKDPRMNAEEKAANRGNSMDLSAYARWLWERCGLESFSYEACGYPVSVRKGRHVLHLPLYQTNTAANCTLRSYCETGSRGSPLPVSACPRWCERFCFSYPDDYHLTGRWNSLFGCSMEEVNDVKALNQYIQNGIGRLVVRL